MKVNQFVSAVSTLLLAFAPAGASGMCDKAGLRQLLQLTNRQLAEPFDTDVFVGADEDDPAPGDSYNWGGNRLCPTNDNFDCDDDDVVGRAYGLSTYLPGNETFVTNEYWVIGDFGTLTISSVEFPGATPFGSVTGGTECFAGAKGQTTATLVEGDTEYYNYDLSGLVLR